VTSITVAVSGIHLGENCQPGPGIARGLRAALGDDVKIVGLAYDVWDSSLHAGGGFDEAFLMPYPSVGPEAYWQRLVDVHRTFRIDVIIPCLDVELPVLQALASQLRSERIASVLPSRSALARRAKHQLPELAKALGVQVPETLTLSERGELERAVQRLGLPLVIKGPHYDAEIVQSFPAAQNAFDRLMRMWGGPILAQRFVRGDEYNVAGVRDAVSGAVRTVTMRKTVVTKLGKAWAGVTVDSKDIADFAQVIMHGTDWHGGCEVELLKDEKGQLFLVEFNPRLPAWNYLSVAAGLNLPHALLQLALGEAWSDAPPANPGVYYVRHATEVVGEMGALASLLSTGRREKLGHHGLPLQSGSLL
jgi:carbamoyl-phosphate synthase large subunit